MSGGGNFSRSFCLYIEEVSGARLAGAARRERNPAGPSRSGCQRGSSRSFRVFGAGTLRADGRLPGQRWAKPQCGWAREEARSAAG